MEWFKKHKILTVIGVFILLAAVASPKDSSNPASTATNTEPAAASNIEVATSDTKQKETVEPAQPKEAPVPAEYKAALAKAKTYSSMMNMSKRGVYDQLVSEYGEKFKPEAAQYAIDNVKADWNANALAKAKTYQNDMNMSPAAIRDQLVSEYGEKFTAAEADYAIQNLNN